MLCSSKCIANWLAKIHFNNLEHSESLTMKRRSVMSDNLDTFGIGVTRVCCQSTGYDARVMDALKTVVSG